MVIHYCPIMILDDVNVLDQLDFKPSSFHVFDRVWALGVIEKAKARLPFATAMC